MAVAGFTTDGRQFVPEAVRRGAAVVVAEQEDVDAGNAALVVVPSARAALGDLAAAFYGRPSAQMAVVGVTGTDGKTSTTHLLSAILEARGMRTGWLSTVNVKVGESLNPLPPNHTTPEAPVVQATLAQMVEDGVDVAIVETSSHALELHRVRGTRYRVGIFTNLSSEHLNFHGTLEAYRAAKAKLFEQLPPDGLAVLNADDSCADHMRERTRARVATFGLESPADVMARDVALAADGTSFVLTVDGEAPVALSTRLVGRFNVSNWLAAFTAARYFGATPDDLRKAMRRQGPVEGRMNLVQRGQPFPVIVDFAHTPQALERALDTVRALAKGRVLLLFGMAGGRDTSNRPIMGGIAAAKSDYFVITTDDAYDEDPAAIARQVVPGATALGAVEGERFVVELDRRKALRQLLERAGADDVVLLAGHGHEQALKVGGQAIPWNDARVAAEELATMGYGDT